MGIAAYNRGSKAIREQIDREQKKRKQIDQTCGDLKCRHANCAKIRAEKKRADHKAGPASRSMFHGYDVRDNLGTFRKALTIYFSELVDKKDVAARVERQLAFLCPGARKEVA